MGAEDFAAVWVTDVCCSYRTHPLLAVFAEGSILPCHSTWLCFSSPSFVHSYTVGICADSHMASDEGLGWGWEFGGGGGGAACYVTNPGRARPGT